MKRALILVVLSVIVVSAAATEAEKPKFMFPWQSTNPDGLIAVPAIAAGFFMDAVGIGLIGGGGAASGAGMAGAGLILTSSGCLTLAGGSLLMGLGTEKRHQGLLGMGYSLDTPSRGLSRTLVWVTLGCAGAAAGISMAVGDTLGGAIAAIIVGAVGAGIEIANLYGPRKKWLDDINASIAGKSAGTPAKALRSAEPRVVPLIAIGARGATLVGVSRRL